MQPLLENNIMLRLSNLATIVVIVATLFSDAQTAGLSCKNPQNETVDWFIVYKIPRLTGHPDANIRNGVGMLYMDAVNSYWIKLGQSINDTNQPIAYTLNQTYQKQAAVFAHYNDELPDGNWTTVNGHTKGSFAFDFASGFWLIHSVPRFPPLLRDNYSYPWSGTVYGQTLFCLSLSYDTLLPIETILYYNYPWIYDFAIDDKIIAQYPLLASILYAKSGSHVSKAPWNNTVTFSTLAGLQINSFAKFVNFSKDIYYDWVAPTLHAGLYTETWQNNGQNLPSNCNGPYPVNNVQNITLPAAIQFSEHLDHSKWAVGILTNQSWVCIGDINRQVSQEGRAGGTHCFRHKEVWTLYFDSVTSIEACSKNKPSK